MPTTDTQTAIVAVQKLRRKIVILAFVFLLGIPLLRGDIIGCAAGQGVTAYMVNATLLTIAIGAGFFLYGKEIKLRGYFWYRGITYKGKQSHFAAYAWMTAGVIMWAVTLVIIVSMFTPALCG